VVHKVREGKMGHCTWCSKVRKGISKRGSKGKDERKRK
jgi:hypothetical protein